MMILLILLVLITLATYLTTRKAHKLNKELKVTLGDYSEDTNKNLVKMHKDLGSKLDYITTQFDLKVKHGNN